jgi:arylsulfatase A-like enzyme
LEILTNHDLERFFMIEHKAPNMLIVLSDQLRRNALSMHGDPNIATTHIDALASRGVYFENACSTYPICVPFRFTFMTGLYAHERKVPGIEYRMAPTERTLADEYNEAGYETIYVGKWHLDGGHGRLGSARQVGRTPINKANQGRWEKWFGFELRNDPFDTFYFEDDDPTPKPIEGYQTDGLFDIGIKYLTDRESTRPFCMVISVEPPHDPFVAPEEVQENWENKDIELPDNFMVDDPEGRDRTILNRKRYYAMVENLDMNVGKLSSFLSQSTLGDDTIVVFISDHGELAGCHGLRGKQWPYEESIGIPFIVSDPRHLDQAGMCLKDPISTEDIFPTVLGLTGLKPRDDVFGTDLTPLIAGQTSHLDREGVMLEFVAELRQGMPFHDWVWRGFRSKRYKYTVRGDNMGGKPWQFFDLQTDPCEMKNLIDEDSAQPEIIRHHGHLCNRIVETRDHFVLLPAFGCEGINMWA